MAVSTMGSFRIEPKQGHLERLTRIFGHLKNYKDLSVKFRTDELDYGEYKEQKYDWYYVYQDLKEQVPKDMPLPKGKRVIMSSFVDASLQAFHSLATIAETSDFDTTWLILVVVLVHPRWAVWLAMVGLPTPPQACSKAAC